MKIKELPKEDRPREKALHYGIETLQDGELLALIIGSGVKGCSALDIARNLLSTYPTLATLANANLSSLEDQLGLSKNTALKLLATFEFHNRLISPMYQNSVAIKDSQDLYQRYRYLENYTQEVLVIVMLSRNNKIIKEKILYRGTEYGLNINPTEICAELIMTKCKKYVLVHNHPNGDQEPSDDDYYTTELIEGSTKALDIVMKDHLIIYPGGYFSFKLKRKNDDV